MWLIVRDESKRQIAKIPYSFKVLYELTRDLAIQKGYTIEEIKDQDMKANTHGFLESAYPKPNELVLMDSISVIRSPDQFYVGLIFPNRAFAQFPYCWNVEIDSDTRHNLDYPVYFRIVVMDKECKANEDDDYKTMIISGYAKHTHIGNYDFHYEPPTWD